MSSGSAMMSTRAEQRRRDPAQLAHPPVGARRHGSRTETGPRALTARRSDAPRTRAGSRRRSAGSRGSSRLAPRRTSGRRALATIRSRCRPWPSAGGAPPWPRARVSADARHERSARWVYGARHSVPAMTPNGTPSRMQSIATLVASRADSSFRRGTPIEPDVSTITISAASAPRRLAGDAVGGHGHDRVDLGRRRAAGTRSGSPPS